MATIDSFIIFINRKSLLRSGHVFVNLTIFIGHTQFCFLHHGYEILQFHSKNIFLDLFDPLHGRPSNHIQTKDRFLLLCW